MDIDITSIGNLVKRFRYITRHKSSEELADFAAELVRKAIINEQDKTPARYKYKWTLSLHGESPVKYVVCRPVFCFVWGISDHLIKKTVEATKSSTNGLF